MSAGAQRSAASASASAALWLACSLTGCQAPDETHLASYERGRVSAARAAADAGASAANGAGGQLGKQAGEGAGEPAGGETPATRSKDFGRRVEQGRALTRAGDYAGALAAFEALLLEDPTHAVARAELGWAAYRAGDLARAQRETLTALEAADKPTRRGMLTYNLGRIVEARGQYDEAIGWYRQSVRYRPNDVVQRRMNSLEGIDAGPEGVEPLELVGAQAWPSLAKVCEVLQGAQCEAQSACSCEPTLRGAARAGRADAAVQAGFVSLQLGTEAPRQYLALEGAAGWHVFPMRAGAGEVALHALGVGEGDTAVPTWVAIAHLTVGSGANATRWSTLCARPREGSSVWSCSALTLTRSVKLELVLRVDEGGQVVVRQKQGEAADLQPGDALRVGRRPISELLPGYDAPA